MGLTGMLNNFLELLCLSCLIFKLGSGPKFQRSRCTLTLINGPFVPHINLWEPCYFDKVPVGPQAYTLNVLWIQEKGAQIRMSK